MDNMCKVDINVHFREVIEGTRDTNKDTEAKTNRRHQVIARNFENRFS